MFVICEQVNSSCPEICKHKVPHFSFNRCMEEDMCVSLGRFCKCSEHDDAFSNLIDEYNENSSSDWINPRVLLAKAKEEYSDDHDKTSFIVGYIKGAFFR